MKNHILLIVCLLTSSVLLTACNVGTSSSSMVKAQRRLEKYLPSENKPQGKVVDLREGPNLRYDSKFGPKDLNFDFKIINPYD